jgi:ribose 5-phosphate isomerase B
MKIAIGSDHAGFQLKETLRNWLETQGHEVNDCGTYSEDRADYPVYGQAVAIKVSKHEVEFGVLVCGSGQGICMAANKVEGVRGAIIRNSEDAEMTRAHNDANVACFGERITDSQTAIAALKVFLESTFEGGRHEGRVKLLEDIDNGKTIC